MTGVEVAIGMAALGAVASAVGTFQSISAQNAAADYNASVAENSAAAARQQAQVNADRVRMSGAKLQGTVRANAAASGLNPDMGSPLEIAGENALNIELDALTARFAGEIKARDFEAEAGAQRMQKRNPWVGAATAALGSAASSAGTLYASTRKGAPDNLNSGGTAAALNDRYHWRTGAVW